MSTPIAYDVIRAAPPGLFIATRQVAEDSAPPGSPWERITAEQFAIESAEQLTISSAISNADLRRGLIEFGINPMLVTSHLNSLPDSPQKWMAITEWEYSNYVERAHPMLDQLAPNFGLTPADIDSIFASKPEFRTT